MRKLMPALILSCVSLAFCGTVSTVSAAGLDRAECRPLTSENARACCAAVNWKHLVVTNDQELCRSLRRGQPLAASLAVGTPESPNPPLGTNPPPGNNPPSGTLDQGQNNGFGNGDQTAPGDSQPNNNAENANNGDGRANPSNSSSSIN